MVTNSSAALRAAIALAVAAAVPASANAASLIVSGGILQGATGVNVDGTLYDVAFRDGTCTALFSGCDEGSDFAFSTYDSAGLAGQALLDQVLIDGPQGMFDSNQTLTAGCNLSPTVCFSFIPYGLDGDVLTRYALNGRYEFQDRVSGVFRFSNAQDTSWASIYNFAVFSNARPLVAAVPEPDTWAMMLLGFLAVGGAIRHARRKQTLTVTYA